MMLLNVYVNENICSVSGMLFQFKLNHDEVLFILEIFPQGMLLFGYNANRMKH